MARCIPAALFTWVIKMFTLYSNITGLRIIESFGRHVETENLEDIEAYRKTLSHAACWYAKEIEESFINVVLRTTK